MPEKSKTYLLLVTTGLIFLALSVFLLLDVTAAVSIYQPFTLVYATFWLVLAAILLRGQSTLAQLLTLSLFVAAIGAIYAINWDSRKAFLKDFQQVESGMTTVQVNQTMQGYIKFVDPASQANEQGKVVNGTVSYRHTTEGWGDSDIGLVVIENGRVAQTEFLPD